MTRSVRILVVDDDADALKVISSVLLTEGYRVDTFTSPLNAMRQLREETYDTILVDYQMPEMSGIEFIRGAKTFINEVPLILITAYGTIPHAVEVVKEGAYHYLTKPLNYDELKVVLRNSVAFNLLRESHKKLEQELQRTYRFHELVGQSRAMKKIFQQIEFVSMLDTAVLILGEKGMRKESVAKAIHESSNRKDAPFISLECSSVAEAELENILFGSEEKGPNGMPRIQQGELELAAQGTLFINEIENLPVKLQEKLLSFLQENKFARAGGSEKVKSNVRIVTATDGELESAVEKKAFDRTLYLHLKSHIIYVPPLRERREDIPVLAEHFLKEFSKKYQKDIRGFSSSVYAKLLSRPFSENVAELEHLVERACIVCQSPYIELEDAPELLQESWQSDEDILSPFFKEKMKVVENFEREYFISLLTATRGRIGEAASLSGLSEKNIYEKLKKYGLKKEDFKGDKNS